MTKALLPIGKVSLRTGIPVKTLRFYADEGLVQPSGRSRSGYRLYADEDVAKLTLVRTLREAGLGLPAIRAVLARDSSLSEALQLRLAAIEAHIASLQQIAAALRTALRSEPTERDIRRLTMVTRLSQAERKALIERFQQRIVEGIPLDAPSLREKVLASAPRLPEEPTPEQLDAWLELAEIIADPAFAASLSSNAREVQARGLDLERLQRLNVEIGQAALQAQNAGATPESAEGSVLCERYVRGLAEVAGQSADDPRFLAAVRQRFEQQDPRTARYWQLVGILNGRSGPAALPNEVAGWSFVVQAVQHHLAARAA